MRITLDEMNIIHSMENNLYHKLQYIPSKINMMNVDNIGDTLIINTGLPSDTFNTAYGGKVDLTKANKVMNYYLIYKMPMAWWFGPSSYIDDNIQNNMQVAGFTHDEIDVGMYCILDEVNFSEYNLVDGLCIKVCKSVQEFIDFGNVMASIFDPIDEFIKDFYKQIYNIPSRERHRLILLIGYVDAKPVSTASLFITDVAGIYDIATRPEERNKGYGSAMFYFALTLAKNKGLRYSVLQASPDGLNIYKRFGYKEVCIFNVWSNKNKLHDIR